jgi:hypothetical protein
MRQRAKISGDETEKRSRFAHCRWLCASANPRGGRHENVNKEMMEAVYPLHTRGWRKASKASSDA